MIIYIAGRITGQFDFKQRFNKAERYLKSRGHIVINPADLPQGLNDYMPTCKALIDQADAIYFMHDWIQSAGANEEHIYASRKGKIIFIEGATEKKSENLKEYWHREAIKATAELGEMKFKLFELSQKLSGGELL